MSDSSPSLLICFTMEDAKDSGCVVLVASRDSLPIQILEKLMSKLRGLLLIVVQLAPRDVELRVELVTCDESRVLDAVFPAVWKEITGILNLVIEVLFHTFQEPLSSQPTPHFRAPLDLALIVSVSVRLS